MTDRSSTLIVLTGNFTVPRSEIVDLLESKGAIIGEQFSPAYKGRSALLVGSDAKPGKIGDARLANIPIVSEETFWKIVDNQDWKLELQSSNNPNRLKRRVEKGAPSPSKRRQLRRPKIATPMKPLAKPFVFPQVLQKSVVALEGNIGVGKSTLGGKLKTSFPSHVDVYEEQTNEGFLQLFYGDTRKYGFAFQWGMLKTRIYQLKLAQHDTSIAKTRKLYVWDRSMIGDYIFALWNYLTGSISTQEMEVYESEFGGGLRNLGQISFLQSIHCLTWLNDEPAACKFRVERLRQHESEQGIPLPYYEGIDDIHFAIFMKLFELQQNKVMVLNWGQYHDSQTVMRHVHDLFTGKRKSAKVSHTDDLPSPLSEDATVYKTAEEITASYESFKSKSADLPVDTREVYFPRDVMTIAPSEKGVRDDHQYDIRFYQNEYKRTVLYHLSQGAHVIFYGKTE